ncbi:MAG: sugar phosphate nucleotidyltransferase [Ignavibacteria bacterium]|nr:sugar phosphate nucleotidyltransferase [Ignavibacteria bacterium]
MKAIIPVAGMGTRLKPITDRVPKVLIPVGDKPMLFHLLDEIVKSGKIDTVILIVGYLGEMIKSAVMSRYRTSSVKFVFTEQKQMLGLGHAVLQAESYVNSEPVLIILGDTVFEFDLSLVLDSENTSLGVKNVDDVSRFGIVEISPDGYIKRMLEKPSREDTDSRLGIAGIYFIKESSDLFRAVSYLIDNNIKTKNEYQLTDALMKMVSDGIKMKTFEIDNWFDCGKPETLLSTNSHLLRRDSRVEQQYPFDNLTVEMPVYISEGCFIENSHIGPNVSISKGVKIINSRVTDSVIMEDAEIVNAELEESIVSSGEKVNGIHSRVMISDGKSLGF